MHWRQVRSREPLYPKIASPSIHGYSLRAFHFYSPKEHDTCYISHNGWAPLLRTAAAKSLQSCPTLCDPIDGSPPGSPVPGILEARTLERVAISFSNAWKWKGKVKSLSHVWLLATPWTAAYQAPPSMGFSRQEYWRTNNPQTFQTKESRTEILFWVIEALWVVHVPLTC